MSVIAALVLFIVGLAIVLFSAEQLVKGVVGTSIVFGVSSFVIAVVFIGFDPDNLSVGAVASFEQVPGIAWGAIVRNPSERGPGHHRHPGRDVGRGGTARSACASNRAESRSACSANIVGGTLATGRSFIPH